MESCVDIWEMILNFLPIRDWYRLMCVDKFHYDLIMNSNLFVKILEYIKKINSKKYFKQRHRYCIGYINGIYLVSLREHHWVLQKYIWKNYPESVLTDPSLRSVLFGSLSSVSIQSC